MARLTYLTPLLVGALTLTACPGDDGVPMDTEGTTGDTDGTTSIEPTTLPPMTDTVDPDSGSTTDDPGPMCDPACPEGQCCIGGGCFAPTPPSCNPGCADTEICACPEGSDPCDCVAECQTCGIDEPSYDPCLEMDCPAGSVCVVDDPKAPTFGWCAVQGCGEDACACPLPQSGTALNNCGSFDGDDGSGSCFLDCSEGDCPEGMLCSSLGGESVCVWPGEGFLSNCCSAHGTPGCDDATCNDAVCAADAFCCDKQWDQICTDTVPDLCPGLCPALPQYGDCFNEALPCDVGLDCLSGANFGWCSTIGCADVADCEPPPATGDAPPACAPILDGGMETACILDCSMDQTCPDGMACFAGSFCVWPEAGLEGFGACGALGPDCSLGEECLDDGDEMMMVDPTWVVCSQPDCVDATECTLAVPPTGDAPVACADPTGMGGPNTCYLDCAGGQTCPDGMTCTNDSWCSWPLGVSTIFSDDFESGDLSAGWTLEDVDMLVPDMNVAFVDAAWVVDSMVDGGNNAAVSTSWYNPAGVSDDWLISPPIMLGPNTRLYWNSRTVNAMFPDSLEVRISTATPAIADFEANAPLATIMPEDLSYSLRYVDFAAAGYMDQPVHIAFRNITNDGLLLLVDNVAVVELP